MYPNNCGDMANTKTKTDNATLVHNPLSRTTCIAVQWLNNAKCVKSQYSVRYIAIGIIITIIIIIIIIIISIIIIT